MPTFEFKAIRQTGEVYNGVIDAEDDKELVKKVRDQGGSVINFRNQTKNKLSFLKKLSEIGFTVKIEDKIMFAKNLGTMIGAGLSVSKALTTLEKQFRNPKFKKVINSVNSSIKKGNSINSSLKEHADVFSGLFISMVRAGEESGKISESLAIVVAQMENSNTLRKKVKGALIYPSIIIVVMIVIGALMLIYIVPTLEATFSDLGTELPLSTRMIVFFSAFLRDNTILFVVLFGLIITTIVLGLKSKKGQRIFDTITLKLPVISTIAKEVNSARTARTMSSLLSSGVDVISAFNITKDVLQNHYYKEILEKAEENIQKGTPVAEIFIENEDLYPPVVGAMIEVGEETGKLPEMLLSVADFYESEVAQKTKNISTIIEPILMVIIGFAVGFFAISMITPMYTLMGSI